MEENSHFITTRYTDPSPRPAPPSTWRPRHCNPEGQPPTIYQLCNFTDEFSSDHSPVILTLRGKPSFDPPNKQLNITNWPKFAVDLHLVIPSPNSIINTTSELNQEIENFTTTVQVAMTKNTSILDNQPNQAHIPDNIQREITKKRRLQRRRAWQNNPEPWFNNQSSNFTEPSNGNPSSENLDPETQKYLKLTNL